MNAYTARATVLEKASRTVLSTVEAPSAAVVRFATIPETSTEQWDILGNRQRLGSIAMPGYPQASQRRAIILYHDTCKYIN